MTAEEVLRDTRALLASTHWGKRAMRQAVQKPEGGTKVVYCLLGALSKVAGTNYYVYNEAADTVQACLPRFNDIISFNDDPATELPEVLAVLDCALKKVTQEALPQ